MTLLEAPAPAPPARPARPALRLALAAGVLVTGLGSVAASPVEGSYADLIASAQRGEVRVVQQQSHEGPGARVGVGGGAWREALLWVDSRHVLHWTSASPLERQLAAGVPLPPPLESPLAPADGSGELLLGDAPTTPSVDLVATVVAAAPPDARPRVGEPDGLVRQRLAQAGSLLSLVLLLLLVVGPQPRRATKWGWAWLLALPWGLGGALLLLREAPWSPATTAEPAPPPGRPERGVRVGGGTTFALVLVAGLPLAGLAWLASVSPLAPDRVPAPYDLVLEDRTRVPAR